MFRFFTIYIFLFTTFQLFGQGKKVQGSFRGSYYSIKDFGSSNQIWTGTRGPEGTVFFGNDQEILVFNGVKWTKIQTSVEINPAVEKKVHKTKVSKLHTASNGKVYVGRENNFGFITFDSFGKMVYKPLYVGDSKNNLGQIWSMYEDEFARIWVIGKNSVFTIDSKNSVSRIKLPSNLSSYTCKTAGKTKVGIILIFSADQSEKKHLYGFINFKTQQFNWIKANEVDKPSNIRGSALINGKTLLFDYNNHVFEVGANNSFQKIDISHPLQKFFSAHQPSVVKQYGNQLYVGTETQGVFILDLKGKIIRRFDLDEGMQNNNVFDLFLDQSKNLWLNLDEGIHFFETSSPITTISKPQGISASIQAIDFESGQPILALNTDLFLAENIDGRTHFYNSKSIQETTFDVKTFEIENQKRTLVIGYEGIYEYAQGKKKNVVNEYAWTIFQNPSQKNQVFVGLESGIGVLTWENNAWDYELLPIDIEGDIIHFSSDGKNLYFGIKGKGLGIIALKNFQFKQINFPKKLDQNSHVYAEVFQNRVYVGSNYGLFFLNENQTAFEAFPNVNNTQFSGKKEIQVHRLYNDQNRKLWLVYYIEKSKDEFEIETGWFTSTKGKYEWNQGALKTIQNGGILFAIKRFKPNEIWLGSDNGLYILNEFAQQNLPKKFDIVIDGLLLNRNPTLSHVSRVADFPSIAYRQNSVDFTFYAATFQTGGGMLYRYRLVGFTDEWSDWSNVTRASFPKLYEGNYTFEVQAKSAFGFLGNTARFSFQVLPPWYRTWWMYLIYFAALVISIFVINRLSIQRVKRQNIRLEKIVTERTHEISEQNEQLEAQKTEITQKSKDIVDSINYAKRIQNTILPSSEEIQVIGIEPMVFFQPKDIVSGDFYWIQRQENSIFFAAIDCTGHGVPGALVSIVGYNGLMRILNEKRLPYPNEILDGLRDIVVDSFHGKGQNDLKDGMDLSLCRLDLDNQMLYFSGAYNSGIIVRNGELIDLKADKQPIGQFENAFPFTLQQFPVQKDDMIYLFTDGYVDQFGGEKGKKLKSTGFKNLLLQASELSIEKQHELFSSFFTEWRGSLEQVDDVCVIGVRI